EEDSGSHGVGAAESGEVGAAESGERGEHAMSIIDKVGALLPGGGERGRHELAPFRGGGLASREQGGQAFRDDLDRWLQRLVEEPLGLPGFASFAAAPRVDTHETDDEVVVTVEVPGVNRDDIDLMIRPECLGLRGETREEREDK